MMTFCWLPPESVVIACSGEPSTMPSRSMYERSRRREDRVRIKPRRLSRSSVGSAKFSRIVIQLKTESRRRSRGT